MSQVIRVLDGRYELQARVAAGGAGEVWRAVDRVLDRPVAVKLVRAEYLQHPETLARFEAEARHAGSLSHPGIAHVYDYRPADPPQPPYLVMELVDGPALTEFVRRGPLGPSRTLDVIAQVAAGLHAAHATGLVHRDIKPGNLLVGPGGIVKITDFGIAHTAGSAQLTRTGILVGTPAYLAPERVTGAPATPASDLYSLGIVGYQCLAGAAPFTGSPIEVALAHQRRALPPLPPDLPPEVARLITDLTAKDPAARPGSAAEVATRTGRIREAYGAAVMPRPGRSSTTRTDALPPRPGVPETATLVAAVPGTLTMALDPGAPAPRELRRRVPWLGWAAVAVAIVAVLIGWLLGSGPGAAAPPRHVAAPAPSTPAVRTVDVNGPALAGRPVSAVRQWLLTRGLRPRVLWTPTGGQPPGTVVSIQPSGQLQPGSVVTLTAVFQPRAHHWPGQGHHHDGNGHGHQNGNGQGGNGD